MSCKHDPRHEDGSCDEKRARLVYWAGCALTGLLAGPMRYQETPWDAAERAWEFAQWMEEKLEKRGW